jgi:tetratricopeptide (TPR) repeat protein
MAGIFISMTEEDVPIADALSAALKRLLGASVQISYSPSPESGPKTGSSWFEWIRDLVRTCDLALILLTPQSVRRSWVLWEAGAVFGAALASGTASQRKVRPLVYQLSHDQLPSPFRDSTIQYQRGDEEEHITKVLNEILDDFIRRPESLLTPEQRRLADGTLGENVATYMATVREILLRSAAVPTDIAIQEWLDRLDALVKQNRRSEVESLQDWMEIAFGKRPTRQSRPVDLRLHTRFAEAHMKNKSWARAVSQLRLAQQLAPRDIYVLRTLGRALLEAKEPEEAEKIVERIKELDKESLVRNVECAALAARLYRETNKEDEAVAILRQAFARNKTSYYLADLLGQASLQVDDLSGATDAFTRALRIIDDSREDNVWVNSTGASSALVLGLDGRAIEFATKIARQKPTEDELGTLERALVNLANHIEDGRRRANAVIDALRPQPKTVAEPQAS